LPVAKRNFVKRHGHDMVNSAKELRDTVDRILPLPSTKGIQTGFVHRRDDSDHSVSFHEVSSDEDVYGDEVDTEPCIEPCMEPYKVARTVSFDETKHASAEPPKAAYLEIGANEELWLPAGLTEPQVTYHEECFEPIDVSTQPQQMYNVVPPSPPMQPCGTSSPNNASFFDTFPRVVPLVEPGATITVTEFEEAIYGIDFASVFD
jgi:hypothetical protein